MMEQALAGASEAELEEFCRATHAITSAVNENTPAGRIRAELLIQTEGDVLVLRFAEYWLLFAVKPTPHRTMEILRQRIDTLARSQGSILEPLTSGAEDER